MTIENDLKEVNSSMQYKVVELKKEDRKIYLLGEAHVKNKDAYILGEKVISHFKKIGYEGINLSKYPPGIRLLAKIVFFILYKCSSIFLYQSTIEEIKKHKDIEIFNIEENHNPSIHEYISFSFLFYAILKIPISIIFMTFLSETPGMLFDSPSLPLIIVYLLWMASDLFDTVHFLLGVVMSLYHKCLYLPLFYGFSKGRDVAMAKSLSDNTKSGETILGIMGMAHLKGVSKLLKEEGFIEKVDIDVMNAYRTIEKHGFGGIGLKEAEYIRYSINKAIDVMKRDRLESKCGFKIGEKVLFDHLDYEDIREHSIHPLTLKNGIPVEIVAISKIQPMWRRETEKSEFECQIFFKERYRVWVNFQFIRKAKNGH